MCNQSYLVKIDSHSFACNFSLSDLKDKIKFKPGKAENATNFAKPQAELLLLAIKKIYPTATIIKRKEIKELYFLKPIQNK